MVETREELRQMLSDANQDIRKAIEEAEQDEKRPVYHFRAPSQWMDDPNGIIYDKGYYHMMYSWNPNSAKHRAGMVYKTAHRVWDPNHEDWTGGITVWGHARSKDLLHWEHLPIALYPVIDKGEHFIWFGTTAVNDNGVPVAIYTSVGPDKRPEDTADQWLWFGDQDMIHWKPAEENPILDYDLNGDEVLTEWRDPFVLKWGGKTWLLLGARRLRDGKGDAVVALYEAQNADYTRWAYRGVIFSLGDRQVPSCECPNLVKIGDKWVLVISLHGKAEYYIGDMDFDKPCFYTETQGMVDYSANFYATNIMEDDAGRKIMYGAVEGFTGTKGWNGCVSLPRVLTVEGGRLVQTPAQELRTLTRESWSICESLREGWEYRTGKIQAGTALLELEVSTDGLFILGLEGEHSVDIRIQGEELKIGEKTARFPGSGKKRRFQVYVDRTVLEVFLGTGECLTAVLEDAVLDAEVVIHAKEKAAEFQLTLHQLDGDGLFSYGEGAFH